MVDISKRIEILDRCEKNAWRLNITSLDDVRILTHICGGSDRPLQIAYLTEARQMVEEGLIKKDQDDSYLVTGAGIQLLNDHRASASVPEKPEPPANARTLDGQDEITKLLINGMRANNPSIVKDTWSRSEVISYCMNQTAPQERGRVALQLLTAWDAAQAGDESAKANAALVTATRQLVGATKDMLAESKSVSAETKTLATETKNLAGATVCMAVFTFLVCVATLATPFIAKAIEDHPAPPVPVFHIEYAPPVPVFRINYERLPLLRKP